MSRMVSKDDAAVDFKAPDRAIQREKPGPGKEKAAKVYIGGKWNLRAVRNVVRDGDSFTGLVTVGGREIHVSRTVNTDWTDGEPRTAVSAVVVPPHARTVRNGRAYSGFYSHTKHGDPIS